MTEHDEIQELQRKAKELVPVQLEFDLSTLSPNYIKALRLLIDAAHLMDKIFIRQVYQKNVEILHALEKDNSIVSKLRLKNFWIQMGPFDRLHDHEPFIKGVPPKPDGANYYPEDMSKEEFEQWVSTLSEEEAKKAKGFYYVIRRDEQKKLKCVPYNEEYKELLVPASKLLHEAADLVDNQSLKKFLKSRADAFLSNDYYQSDVDWVDVDQNSPLDITIGPYEVYEDRLYGYKASFEAFICIRDFKESEKLKKYGECLQMIEDNLPIDPKYRNPKIGADTPILVVDEVLAAGDRGGVQTAAFNLPNDERVVAEKGSKKVMLKNVQKAKFEKILVPIADLLIHPSQRQFISFDAFFTHILCHELLHGLGPHNITVNGKSSTVRQELQELHSAVEEAKADICGVWALQFLMDKGIVDKSLEQSLYVTYLAGAFRSIRFGLEEAHGKGQAVQLNFLMDEGGLTYNKEDGTFSVDFDKIKPAVTKLVNVILTLQAEGSKHKAKELLDTYGVNRDIVKSSLDKLSDIAIDIAPLPIKHPELTTA